jgi:hypothetical protein
MDASGSVIRHEATYFWLMLRTHSADDQASRLLGGNAFAGERLEAQVGRTGTVDCVSKDVTSWTRHSVLPRCARAL